MFKNRVRYLAFFSAAALLVSGCSYIKPPSNFQPGSEVGGTGDLQYDHEQLGAFKHLLTVTAAPGFMETEGSIAQRVLIFANKYAAKTCPTAFEFVNDPNLTQGTAFGWMKRTRSYVFVCKI